MAIMRSNISKGEGGNWLGVQKSSVKSFTDESSKYDWADIYLVIEFDTENSKYSRPCKIVGSFERDASDNITDCPLLKRLTYACDALGFQGGVNQKGQWVTEAEEPIADIAAFLNERYAHMDEPQYDYLTYVYKELAKNGKVYTRVHSRFVKDGKGAHDDLKGYIDFLIGKGFLKEATEDQMTAAAPVADLELDGLEIASL